MNVLGEIKQKRNYQSNEEFEEKHIGEVNRKWTYFKSAPRLRFEAPFDERKRRVQHFECFIQFCYLHSLLSLSLSQLRTQ